MNTSKTFSLVLLIFGCLLALPLSAQDHDPRISPLARRFLEKTKTPGLTIGIIHNGQKQFFAEGKAIDGSENTPDRETLFEIGSVTKVFTALALADAVERQVVSLDDPVQKLLPQFMHAPTRDGVSITLRHLATHTSGLPRIPGVTLFAALVSNNPYANFDAKALAIFLNSHSLRRKPGETFEYSNLGGGLLGFALANQAETTYENLIIGRITQPLGMLSTKITLTDKDQVRLASPHLAGGGKAAYWTFDSMAGAGALRSSAKDMLTFVQANLLPEATPLVAALTTTHKPQHATSAPKTRVGLGWMITESPTGTLIWHNGGTGGFSSFIGFDPDRKLGVVVLANSAAGVDPLAYDIWNVLTEPPPKSSEAK